MNLPEYEWRTLTGVPVDPDDVHPCIECGDEHPDEYRRLREWWSDVICGVCRDARWCSGYPGAGHYGIPVHLVLMSDPRVVLTPEPNPQDAPADSPARERAARPSPHAKPPVRRRPLPPVLHA